MSLYSDRNQALFNEAQHAYDNQVEPDDEPQALTLPDYGICPHCRKELAWDGVDDTKAWCQTPGCRYDNGISEDENRRLWEEAQA